MRAHGDQGDSVRTVPMEPGHAVFAWAAVFLAVLAGLARAGTPSPEARSATPGPAAAAVTASAPAAQPAIRTGSTGTLQAEVVLGPRITSRRMRFALYPDPSGGPAARAATGPDAYRDEYRNVVVYLESSGALDGPARAGDGAAVRQEGLSFRPHVLPVVKGTTVEFPNADTVFHNVFSLSHAATFDLGRYPRGETRSVRFDRPGIVKVFCHIHSDMSAVVLVLDNPFFAVVDAAGTARIEGVPPGTYTAVAWHERARRVARTVRIEAGAATQAAFSIPLEDAGD